MTRRRPLSHLLLASHIGLVLLFAALLLATAVGTIRSAVVAQARAEAERNVDESRRRLREWQRELQVAAGLLAEQPTLRFYLQRGQLTKARALVRAFHAAFLRDSLWISLVSFALAAVAYFWLPLNDGLKIALLFGCLSAPAAALIRINGAVANSVRRYALSYVPDFLYRPGLLLAYWGGAALAAAAGATVVQHPVNLGQGAALQTGFEYSLSMPWMRWVVTFDADVMTSTRPVRARSTATKNRSSSSSNTRTSAAGSVPRVWRQTCHGRIASSGRVKNTVRSSFAHATP